MADLISELASKSGVSVEQAKKGLGAVLALFKQKLPANVFSQIQAAVPGADGMMAEAEAAEEPSGGGLLGSVKEMASKLFGGSGAALAAKCSHLGFSADQLQKFIPNVLEFLKGKLPADVMKKVSGLIPAGEKAGV
jgi:hypothetical protein